MPPSRFSVSLPRLALLFVLLLAACLRFWQLGTFPPGLYHDEAYNGLDALSLVQGKQFPQFYEGWELYAQDAHGSQPPAPTRFPLFFEGNYGREPLHVYLMALSIWLFGAVPFAVRAVPAFFGVLAVWTTYLAARELLEIGEWRLLTGKRQSLISNPQLFIPTAAAYILAVLVPAIHFSRFGIRAMVFVPIEMLTVYFFWRGCNEMANRQTMTRRVVAAYLLAGFFLGLGIYTYAAARLFPLLFAGFVLFWAWHDWSSLRKQLGGVVGMALVSLLTAVPLLRFFWQYPYFFVFRIAYVANKGKGTVPDRPWLTWLLNIGRVVRGLYWQGETHLRHNLPGRPYLDPIQAVLFTFGLVQLWRKKANPRTVFLAMWLVVMLLPTILSGDAPHFGRMTGAAGVVAIVAAWGLHGLLNGRWLHAAKWRQGFLVVLLLGGMLGITLRDYFGRYASHPELAANFYLPDWQVGLAAANAGPETAVYLTPTQEEMATIYFAMQNPDGLRSFSRSQTLLPLGKAGKPVLYLIRPDETDTLTRLQNLLPQGEAGEPIAGTIPYYVPVSQIPVPDLQPGGASWDGQIALAGYVVARQRDALQVTLVWQAEQETAVNYTAYVHLLAPDGTLAAQQDRPPDGYPTSDWQPGERIMDTFTIPLPPDLPAGTYTLETGFYQLPDVIPLGQPVRFTEIVIE